jgi:hypothetical protein
MKTHWQETLESVGIPVSLAAQSAEIIQKESKNPHYQRTPQEQKIISHAHTWWVAQGMKTTGKKNDE